MIVALAVALHATAGLRKHVSIALHVLCVLLLSVCCCDAAVSYRGVLLVKK